MRATPRLRGGVPLRVTVLMVGLFCWSAGIVAYLESGLGLPPWDVLHQGIADHTALSFGGASIVVGLLVVGVAWLLGARLGPATWLNAFFVGAFIIVLMSIDAIDHISEQPLGIRLLALAAGVGLIGAGSGLYMGADFGAGPRDTLMVVGVQRTHRRIAVVRSVLEISVLVAGFALGGTIGIGTAVFALTIGPSVEALFWALERTGPAHP